MGQYNFLTSMGYLNLEWTESMFCMGNSHLGNMWFVLFQHKTPLEADASTDIWLCCFDGICQTHDRGHSHQLLYGSVPLYKVDFEKPVSLKLGVMPSNFPKIGYYFGVGTTSGAQDYELLPKIGCVFRVRTTLGTRDYEIFPNIW